MDAIAAVEGEVRGFVRHGQRRAGLGDLWRDVLDNVASAVRAGLALLEALTRVGTRAPVVLPAPLMARIGRLTDEGRVLR